MRTVYEIIVGALIFIGLNKLCKLISASIVDTDSTIDENHVKKAMLKIELMTLFTALFIAIHFV
jgi:hypothetical protein